MPWFLSPHHQIQEGGAINGDCCSPMIRNYALGY